MIYISIYNPYTGEKSRYYGRIIKETKNYITFETNPNFLPNMHHGIITVPKSFIKQLY